LTAERTLRSETNLIELKLRDTWKEEERSKKDRIERLKKDRIERLKKNRTERLKKDRIE